jgi:predicted transcriptional regulator of viral defense system
MPEALAPAFTLADAKSAGWRKDQVYDLLKSGEIDRVGRGVYVQAGAIDPVHVSLAAATALHATATWCLTSSLTYHGLSDAIPFGTDIALPRGTRHPSGFAHVSWHSFDDVTFSIGRTGLTAAPGLNLAVYSAERTIIDCFRLIHQEGSDVAYTALNKWVGQRGNSPSSLLTLASSFPKALPRLRQALEVLL